MSLSCRIERLWAKLSEPGALRVLSHAVALAPRLIVHIASIAVLAGVLNACVPATRYEEAKSASEVEFAGRQRAEAELHSTRAQLEALQAELGQRDQKLAETEQSVSETKLENSVAVKERDEATGLVAQLRGDLARVGDNLRSYAKDKADLEQSLAAAVARKVDLEKNDARTAATARLMRDLTSALGDRVTSGDVSLDVRDGRVLLSAPTELWFDDGAVLRPGIDSVLSAISRVLAIHPESSAELRTPAPEGDKRGAALLAALTARGAGAARVTLNRESVAPVTATPQASPTATPAPQSQPAVVELLFSAG